MRALFLLFLFLLLFTVLYLLFWPVSIDPVSWQAPSSQGLVKTLKANNKLDKVQRIDMGSDNGPEDFAINSKGVIAVSSHSGNILLKGPSDTVFKPWVNTGGRPLGLAYDSADNLYVADAHMGLLKIDKTGNITVELDEQESADIVYADDVDVAENGVIYLTDATTKFSAQRFEGTLNASLLEIMEHRGNGKLIEFNPATKVSRVLISGLVFANGVAVSNNGDCVFVNETGSYRILRYWLQGPKAGSVENFVDNLPGFPDNLSITSEGNLWVGLATPRNKLIDYLSNKPLLRTIIQRFPAALRPNAVKYGHVIKVGPTGEIIESLQSPSGEYSFTTGVLQTAEGLYLSSLTETDVGFLAIRK